MVKLESLSNTDFNQLEQPRLESLESYELLDTSAEKELDELIELASEICGTPISLISFISKERQWFKSKLGFDLPETPVSMSFCAHTIEGNTIFEVNDAKQDGRFQENSLVRENPNIRFYAAAPLVTQQGCSLGTLSVLDTEPRFLSEEQRNSLKLLARQVVLHFELRRLRIELAEEQEEHSLLKQCLLEVQELLVQSMQRRAAITGAA